MLLCQGLVCTYGGVTLAYAIERFEGHQVEDQAALLRFSLNNAADSGARPDPAALNRVADVLQEMRDVGASGRAKRSPLTRSARL